MLPLQAKAAVPQLYQSALALQKKGAVDQAIATYRHILARAPGFAEAHFQMARVFQTMGFLQDAAKHIEQALALRPKEPAIWSIAAQIYAALADRANAVRAFDQWARLQPKSLKPKADKAVFLQGLGEFEAAERILKGLVKRHPYDGELYRIYAGGQKLNAGDSLIANMKKALKHPKQGDVGKVHLNFAMAKAMEDSGQKDKVFQYLDRANVLQQAQQPFDRAAREKEIITTLNAQKGLPAQDSTEGAPTPIFVTGMPRSGTTMIERILAAHSQVQSGGELGYALKLAFLRLGAGGVLRGLQQAKPEALAQFARDYRRALSQTTGAQTGFVTDKSINSELVFGAVQAALPDARFVVIHRDPRSIALSIYKNHFLDGTHRYSNDLADIAWMIHRFEQNVAFWRDHLPGRVYEVRYEDIVQEPEAQVRALIEAVGLPWEDACLHPESASGAVRTLSLLQARQPIQASRVASWKQYEAEMKPFTDAWEALTT